ncbi:caspase family protein [Kamptonema sp. UHCC 0994]|uniref:caspase family protein n=1 Tax=Kamptonema sp. UHCC 0994 TaxID=3031329 RepID=UPI0023BA6289|nr:caspase family protein [Kamptonema sp. UHCC 0994]MDF0556627.1 caspase family protein [Kamptonema sp. UHCC 0994]
MKHNACIAIGINQYQFLQPLSYAQEDAEALHGYLVGEAGFSPEVSLSLTDSSPTMWGNSTYPSRENILKLIDSLCSEHLQHGDLVWCFFSGYGVSYEGQDYLMPIDGNPADVPGTGISVKSLFESLKRAPTETVLVLLDMNRSQSVKAGESIGTQTAELARLMEIPTVLSCRPNQVSRETSALRQGFFAAALLEGLRSGQCTTIKNLDRFLSDRLPQLCDHHLRPKQEPLMVVNPPGKAHQVILPDSPQLVAAAVGRNGSMSVGAIAESQYQPQMVTAQINSPGPQSRETGEDLQSAPPPPPPNSAQGGSEGTNSVTPENSETAMSDKSFLQQLILYSGVTALALLIGVFLTNRSVFLGRGDGTKQLTQTAQNGAAPSVPMVVPSPVSSNPGAVPEPSAQARLDRARVLLKDGSASSFSDAIAKVRKVPANDPLYPQAQEDIERWSLTILDIANGRAGGQNFQGAISAAKLVPDVNPPIRNQAQQAIALWQGLAKQQQTNDALLKSAQKQIKRGVASSYSKAIEQASQIKPGQPKYEEAQKSVGQWSDTILNIAQLRGSQGRLSDAVEAAKLVPSGTSAYANAQKAIATWKTKLQAQKKA